MATSASAALLKGKAPITLAATANPPEPAVAKAPIVKMVSTPKLVEPAPVANGADGAATEEVDIETMSLDQLDDVVKKFELKVPDNWPSLEREARIVLLKQLAAGDEPAAEAAPKKKAPKKGSKAAKEAEAAAAAATAADVKPAEPAKAPSPSNALAAAVASSKPAGKKLSSKAGVHEGEVLGPDPLSNLVKEIENLERQQALELVDNLEDATGFAEIRLGGVLSVIQKNKWFDPYATLAEYAEKGHGIHYRKASYLIQIYNNLTKNGIPYAKIAKLRWTKLKELAPILTKENLDDWLKSTKDKTALQINEMVKSFKKQQKQGQLTGPDDTSKDVTLKTFKVHGDQKKNIDAALAKAKSDIGTDVDTVALEAICLDFLGAPPSSLKTIVSKLGLSVALEAFNDAFPNVLLSVQVYETAAQAAEAYKKQQEDEAAAA